MSFSEMPHRPRSLEWAIALSLAVHGMVLFALRPATPVATPSAPRLEASLGKREAAAPVDIPVLPGPAPAASPRPRIRPKVLTAQKRPGLPALRSAPRWSAAEKAEMDRFLGELSGEARDRPGLARRSLAMAEELGRHQASQEDGEAVTLERLPDSPPVDPFSLEMYLDSLVKKLNRSAGFVRNDPRSKGVQTAAVRIRLNPNGSLAGFQVLDAGDQRDEIAFIRAVVERAVPFSPFPPDLRQSARTLSMFICILPAGAGGGGFGFTRNPGGRGC
ncbi:MAG: hypothetical protein H6R10_3024 [Rhodocyclaceae bacterium]|nr:hypothetical protein [Rhodocyclaceae bacterium]